MPKSDEIPWKRLFVEGAAIVASILLAFAIDAWWETQVERQSEREILLALLDDFEKSKANIIDWRNFHLAVKESNTRLLEATTSSNVTLSNQEIDGLLNDLSWWDPEQHFTTGALNSAIYGAELSVIEDDSLRRLLADWPSQIEYVANVQNQDYMFFLNVWSPFLRENGYLLQLAAYNSSMPGRPDTISMVTNLQIETYRSHSTMIASDEFQNTLVQKSGIQFDILYAFDEVEVLLDQTIQKIESNL